MSKCSGTVTASLSLKGSGLAERSQKYARGYCYLHEARDDSNNDEVVGAVSGHSGKVAVTTPDGGKKFFTVRRIFHSQSSSLREMFVEMVQPAANHFVGGGNGSSACSIKANIIY